MVREVCATCKMVLTARPEHFFRETVGMRTPIGENKDISLARLYPFLIVQGV
jgi:hypothetical protein